MVVVGIYGGYKRGLVLELGDIFALLFGFVLAYRIRAPLSKALYSGVLSAWGEDWVRGFVFLLVFIPVAGAILTAGFHLDRTSREHDRIPREVSETLGILVAIPKYLILACLITAWFNQSSMVTSRLRPALRKGPLVQTIRTLNPMAQALVSIAMPSDEADEFIKKGIKKNF